MSYLPLLDSLEALGERHAELELQLYSGTQGDIARWVEGRRADLGLLFRQEQMPASLERRWLGNVPLVLVVGQQHPLAQAGRVSQRELACHRQLLIAPRESTYPDRERISARIWRADSLYAMAELAARNLGWALLPLHVVQYPVYREQLVTLQADWAPPAWQGGPHQLFGDPRGLHAANVAEPPQHPTPPMPFNALNAAAPAVEGVIAHTVAAAHA